MPNLPFYTIAIVGKQDSHKQDVFNKLLHQDIIPRNIAIENPILVTHTSLEQLLVVVAHTVYHEEDVPDDRDPHEFGSAFYNLDTAATSNKIECKRDGLVATVVSSDMACPKGSFVNVSLKLPKSIENLSFLYLPDQYALDTTKQFGQNFDRLDCYFGSIQCVSSEEMDVVSTYGLKFRPHKFHYQQSSIVAVTTPDKYSRTYGNEPYRPYLTKHSSSNFFFVMPECRNIDNLADILRHMYASYYKKDLLGL